MVARKSVVARAGSGGEVSREAGSSPREASEGGGVSEVSETKKRRAGKTAASRVKGARQAGGEQSDQEASREVQHSPSVESLTVDNPSLRYALEGLNSHVRLVGGYRMHYLDEGSGPVVVMVHGNPTWCFLFRHLVRALRDSFRLIVPDHIGCGLSERTPGHVFRAQDRVDHLDELLKQLGVSRFSLVMHDWGGSIGTALAQRRVADVDKLVYFNTTLGEIDELPRIIRLAASPFIGEILTKYTKTFLRLTTSIGAYHPLSAEAKRGYLAPYETVLSRQAIWDFVSDIPFFSAHPSFGQKLNLEDGLKQLAEKPVKVMWGLKDPCFHPGFLRKMRGYFPRADIDELPHASHLVLEDEPERVGTAVREFLTRKATVSQGAPKRSTTYGAVRAAVAAAPERAAVIVPAREVNGSDSQPQAASFCALWRLVQQYRRGLSARGMLPGDRVLMLVSPGVDFLSFTLAILGNGGIPVFVDPGVGPDNLKRCIDDAGVIGVISESRVLPLRALWFRQFQTVRYHCIVSDVIPLPGTSGVFKAQFEATDAPEVERSGIEMIAYTSGGTGVPKGVLFTPEMLTSQLALFRSEFGFSPGDVDLPILPIFSLFDISLGMTAVIPPIDPGAPLSCDPSQLGDVIDRFGVTSSFGSPTVWGKLAAWAAREGRSFRSLKRVLLAGAPVADGVLSQVQGVIPEGKVTVPYGATEALPVSVISAAERFAVREQEAHESSLDGQYGVPIGLPVAGLSLRVKPLGTASCPDAWGGDCAPGEIGELWVAGSTVSVGYLHGAGDTSSKRYENGVQWHALGDVGYIAPSGMAYFCGRLAHVVHAETLLCPIPVERIVNAVEGVQRSALVSLGERGAGVVVEPRDCAAVTNDERRRELSERVRDALRENSLTGDISAVFIHPSFPVDGRHNAKIFRDKLSTWAQQQRP